MKKYFAMAIVAVMLSTQVADAGLFSRLRARLGVRGRRAVATAPATTAAPAAATPAPAAPPAAPTTPATK
jgi:hypothetical protein